MVFFRRSFAKTFNELKPYDGFAGAIAIDNKDVCLPPGFSSSMVS
jgi:hypothetical protein